MSALKKYKVIRRMEGDRLYEAGDVRELAEHDAATLLRFGALELFEPAASTPLENKDASGLIEAPRRGRPPKVS